MKLPNTHQRESVELKMTPMIDVVFLLLVFFVWTSSFETPEFDLPSAIAEPPAGGTEISDTSPTTEAFDEIVIRLTLRDAVEVIELNGATVDGLPQLQQRLAEIIALGVQPAVIIDPAEQIRMNMAVQVYDVARAAGADRVLFAAQPE
ncbi:MAG: biopolymer transporter ExbD [Rubripirellula sp.]